MSNSLANYSSAFVATVAAVIATFAIWHNISINRRNKRIDIIAGCNARYDTLYDLRLKLIDDIKPKRDIASYYGRYWGLKSDQFDYWLAGFVDVETFTDWCFMTVKAFSDNKSLLAGDPREGPPQSLSFDWGWIEVGLADHQVTNPWFAELTWALRELGTQWEQSVLKLGNKPESSSVELIQRNARKRLLDILRIIIAKSSTYRLQLQHDMTQDQYERSADELGVLGLTRQNRRQSLRQIRRRKIYWYFRRLPILGPLLARLHSFTRHSPKTLGLSNRKPRPSRTEANAA
jgi:hypothetical protein